MNDPGIQGALPTGRQIKINTPLRTGALVATRLEGEDALSRCFGFCVTVVTAEPDAAVEGLLGLPVTVWLDADSHPGTPINGTPINGLVRSVAGRGVTRTGYRRFEIELAPRLWFLNCSMDCRIFQNQSVPAILATVFQDQGLTDVAFRIDASNYPPLDYCVQYQETALDFVSRLMEHVGLFYWHEHTDDKHLLVVADRNGAAAWCNPPSVSVSPNRQADDLQHLDFRSIVRPGKWTLNDYDFESPTKQLLANTPTTLKVAGTANNEIYRWAGKYSQADTGRALSRIRMEMEEARHRQVGGAGHCAGFAAGRRVTVANGPDGPGAVYLLTEVRHRATSPAAALGEGDAYSYENDFTGIAATVPYRPALTTAKPVMPGAQTATVVGPAGEAIHCDAYGRVRVQFHWDRRGLRNDQSSCWIRVAQTRAGSYYGTPVIPHVGHEVIVSFLEGDPDQPLITGAVANALTMPPMGLPSDKHKTIQRDHGHNKIVMQGKAGQANLSMMSPRAVNVFASGPSARSLSAASPYTMVPPPASPSAATLTFYADPTPYSLAAPNSGTQTSAIGTMGYNVPVFQDGIGLQELYNEWYGTTQSDVDNSSIVNQATTTTTGTDANGNLTTTASQGSYGTQDGTAGDSYLNWGSQGRINCLALTNINTWVYGNSNTWTNGQANTEINGPSTTTINNASTTVITGDSTTTIGTAASPVTVNSTIWGTNNSIVGGANATTLLGDNTTTWLGTNQTFAVGISLDVKLGAFFEVNTLKSGSKTTHLKQVGIEIWDALVFIGGAEMGLNTSQVEISTPELAVTL